MFLDDSIAKTLGITLALLDQDLRTGSYNVETLQMIDYISNSYRNFVSQGFGNFREEFDEGYRLGQRDIRIDEGLEVPAEEPQP